MDKNKKKALEAAGFRVGDASDFLGLTDEECRLVELRVAVSRKVRLLREKNHLTQKQLAAKIDSSQSRVAKIESASNDVSLDLMFRGFFAAGGKLSDLTSRAGRNAAPPAAR
ncbi:MAG: helix-turn-helix transcriptional regulator [Singulisphaera sp.]|nr:helix-turn-helix transcriptional regulator [Singulisphaera sp.]